MNMLLYFLRHGDALQNSHIDDNKRPLTDLGVRQEQTPSSTEKKCSQDLLVRHLVRRKAIVSLAQNIT